ncbi:MAG: hypothetical protein LBO00_06520 [Zoogloeaceae bacterium]|jgi:hypothetical protein|nr:hypothetical protein [Zoogloeaceae bacterium]
MSKSQKQKCVDNLHAVASAKSIAPVLEVSSKSREALGVSLSAFNLKLSFSGRSFPVECAFQGAKVFEHGGPFTDLHAALPWDAKRDPRLKSSGCLLRFSFFGEDWPLQPTTAFYDWLYITALLQKTRENPAVGEALLRYAAFSDIEFNPEKSLNCQARSVALWVALTRAGLPVPETKGEFLALVTSPRRIETQAPLF